MGLLKLKSIRLLKPPPRIHPAVWLGENVTMPPGTETAGQPFSLDSFPHHDGPLDSFFDPTVRRLLFQWGTRLGKTTLCLSLMSYLAATNPRNMMFSSPDKAASGKVVGSRLYPILESTDGVKHQLLPQHRRSVLQVKLAACRVFVGWSGSASSLADVGAYFGVGNEIDKWDSTASNEADPLKLFLNRFKGFPYHKIILESTPTIKGRSRIEREMQASKQHRRYVPCPHCGEFQILRKGSPDTVGGIKWDHDSRGRSDPELAFRTAWYQCERCERRIDNHHRKPMLRKGIWVPDGCTVNLHGEIGGVAIREGCDVHGFGPLPSWYALTETWGAFPRQWLAAQGRPKDLQDVVNSYMAETWEVRASKSTPEIVGDRLKGRYDKGVVPVGVNFLTVSIDRQQAEGGFVVWVVLGHGAEDRAWLISYGTAPTLQGLWEPVIRDTWPHQDQGDGLIPALTGIDSGWDPKTVYDFVNSHKGTIAIKGANHDLGGVPYKTVLLTKTVGDRGQPLTHVATDLWETDLQSRLDDKLAGEPGSLTLCREAAYDVEFLQQLCNATLTDQVDNRGNAKLLWVKKDENTPNDFRDAVRYGLCLGRMISDRPKPSRALTAAEIRQRRAASRQQGVR